MYCITPHNSTNHGSDNCYPSAIPTVYLGVFGGICGLFLILFIFCKVKLHYYNRQPHDDITMNLKAKKADLRAMNIVNPSQRYGAMKQSTDTPTYLQSAETCAICLEILIDQDHARRLKCKHVFHTDCIDSWFQKRHIDCPLCKSIFIANRRREPEVLS
ncbi:hypothetical protein BGZ63DRAFT_203575 [Mariannaea sp. PMI_226]|nr:hypothetical protein BGZ63DRAFT_203575 [Mariannaea sp. PMI_226]